MRKVFLVPICILYLPFLISCSLSPNDSSVKGAVYVISVGLNYESSIITTLYGAPHDASETAACLSSIYNSKGLDVHTSLLVTDEERDLSARGVLSTVTDTEASEDDLLVFYFSGHGSVDSRGFFLALQETEESPYYTRLYTDDLIEEIEKKNCAAVLILDACYCGSAGENHTYESSVQDALKNIFESKENSKISIICSSDADSVSYMSSVINEDRQIEKHSLFTLKVLQVLGWEHSGSVVTKIETEDGEREVYGYQGEEVGKTSVRDLYEASLNRWGSSRQVPFTNRTSVPVLLIP